MILPKFLKRRTSRRTSKRRQSLDQKSTLYQSLEPRQLLTTFVVTTADDIVDSSDGQLSLREAVLAANANEAFSDAPAGDEEGDRIVFESGEVGADPSDIQLLTLGELEITDDLVIVGRPNESVSLTRIESGFNSRIFNVNTTEPVTFNRIAMSSGEEIRGGLLQIQPGGDVSILNSYLAGGQARIGGAIHMVSSDLFIYRSTIDGNAADEGGGIHAATSNIRLNDVLLSGNMASGQGGGIFARQGTVAAYGSRFGTEDGSGGNKATTGGAISLIGGAELLSNSNFTANDGNSGGAIFGGNGTSINVFGGSFRANGMLLLNDGFVASGSSGGGAISAAGERLYIANTDFSRNIAINGGAILSAVDGGIFRNLTVEDNTATTSGGGLVLRDDSYLFDSEIVRNGASGDGANGGGIAVDAGDFTAVLRRVRVAENLASSHGGGIAIEEGARTRVFNSDVASNSVGAFSGDDRGGGGGISNRGGDLLMTNARINSNSSVENSHGAGIFSSGGSVLAFDTSVMNNSAESFGGGFYLADGYARFANSFLSINSTREAGGGAFVESGRLVFVGGAVSDNSALAEASDSFQGYGGGVAVAPDGQLYARAEVRFDGNRADSSGGGISSNGLVNIRDARVVSNSANVGGGINVGVNGRAFIDNTNFDFNTATRHGSAIFARGESVLVLSNSLVRNNEVTNNPDGAPVVSLRTGFSRLDSLFRNNTPLNDPIEDAIV